ncbi:MAG: AAA-like domain-containing protein, partial [Candidatus Rariloculaceae bacterium]
MAEAVGSRLLDRMELDSVSSVLNTGDFFVTAGPVQPGRPCYIERDSDEALSQALRDQSFCYVLGPRATGKTSLMARTIRLLRAEGQSAAVVDLAQIGARGESEDPGRWYYGIAYRIVRELRLKVNLQRWWQDKSTLMGDERLAEFFWEIVLTNTTVPVTIFFDEIERAVDLPFSKDLFTAIRSCYNSRTTEPDFGRLNLVVLGVATPQQLAPDRTVSPFDLGTAIQLEDFSREQTYQLVPGFPTEKAHARMLLDKIYRWVGGQPYLTQKIARGVVRRGSRSEDVELMMHERFLAPGARREEPLLNHISTLLTRGAQRNRQALALLGSFGKGAQVPEDPVSVAQQLLRLAGLSSTDDEGMLIVRNRLLSTVFNSRWVR